MKERVDKGAKKNVRGRKRKRIVDEACVYIEASFNNTIITFTDLQGNVLCTSTAGAAGFKGSKKSTPFAGQVAAEKATAAAIEGYQVKTVMVMIKGPGPGRDAAIRALHAGGLKITLLKDITPLAHNGCRARKKRRV